jgi:hypothetical protein
MYSELDQRLLRDILESHDPAQLVAEVNARLVTERTKREEFYNLIHENVKAEFIGGEIIFHSPVRAKHWRTLTKITNRLGPFVEVNQLGEIGIEKVLIAFGRNDFEPDVVFYNVSARNNIFSIFHVSFRGPVRRLMVLRVMSRRNALRDRYSKHKNFFGL